MLREVLSGVLSRIKPSPEEEKTVLEIASAFKRAVEQAAKKRLSEFEVFLAGSVAKGTWLRGDADVDIFVAMPPELNEEEFKALGLEIGREALAGYEVIERYAEHPYVESEVREGIKVSVIPAYIVEPPNWKSAVDRTKFHTEYVLRRMSNEQRDDVRLLKKFCKAHGIYGAEASIKGFSGYLCELLILYAGDFPALIKSAVKWRGQVVIDLEGYYTSAKEVQRKFPRDPLIVVDPVDRNRNVAAALSPKSLAKFVLASRELLARPRAELFEEPVCEREAVIAEVTSAPDLVAVVLKHPQLVEDIAYPQLERIAKKLARQLEVGDFSVIRSFVGHGRNTSLILFVLESSVIPKLKVRIGPDARDATNSAKFLAKHENAWVSEDGRLMALVKRRHLSAVELIRAALAGGFRVGSPLSELLSRSRVLTKEELVAELSIDEELVDLLKKYALDTVSALLKR